MEGYPERAHCPDKGSRAMPGLGQRSARVVHCQRTRMSQIPSEQWSRPPQSQNYWDHGPVLQTWEQA